MIEIKEDKLNRLLELVSEHGHKDLSENCEICIEIKQLKHQLRQDHEDAEKFNDINYMSESHKECANSCANFAEQAGKYKDSLDEFAEHIDQAIKDRQIVKELKGFLEDSLNTPRAHGIVFHNPEYADFLQKILEEEK